jgi:hypothetical protein
LPGSGEQLNDVGNRVIVPKDGESFSDTMARAVASGKTVTQPQIDAEMRTAPAKVAQTLTAAPVIGAAGAAALTFPPHLRTGERGSYSPRSLTRALCSRISRISESTLTNTSASPCLSDSARWMH